jgi:predicted ATPase
VLWLIEDTHWIDPTTSELIELALDCVSGASVLLLITARPTFVAPFARHSVVTRLALNRLARAATQSIVARITRGERPPEVLLDEITARTDGVPLFVEEMPRRAVRLRIALRAGGAAWRAAGLSRTVPALNAARGLVRDGGRQRDRRTDG